MAIVKHRFRKHELNPDTETLIIGTFNPDTPENVADFFYGRQRNFLWTLVPKAFGDESLKGKTRQEKIEYIRERKIDFIDLISEVSVEEVSNYDDDYLDSKVTTWRNVLSEIEQLKKLNKVCFSRKSFSGIPKMKERIENIRLYCEKWGIRFEYLTTPARFYRADKQDEWTNFLNRK
jgi:G:T/U-mismatch repair DNA glycosylase